MSLVTVLVASAGLGLASSFHCAAMCGPLVVASCGRDRGRATTYAVARLTGYSIIGAIAGALAAPIAGSWQAPVRILAAAVAAFVIARAGLRLLRPAPDLVQLKTRAPKRRAFPPALLGLATAVFPCGALLSGVVVAAGSGGALAGALSMLTFALASFPGLLVALVGASSLARRIGHVRRLAGVALLAVAGLTMVEAAYAVRPNHSCCHHAG
jgi:sulfite exporter TauE/SafE